MKSGNVWVTNNSYAYGFQSVCVDLIQRLSKRTHTRAHYSGQVTNMWLRSLSANLPTAQGPRSRQGMVRGARNTTQSRGVQRILTALWLVSALISEYK